MAEKIYGIEEIGPIDPLGSMEGYQIVINKRRIEFLMDTEPQCHEEFGYLWSNENPQDFVGATLLGIDVVDNDLKKEALLDNLEKTLSNKSIDRYINAAFINVETDKGTLQFVAYNIQNGYYGHYVAIRSVGAQEWDANMIYKEEL